MYSKFIWSANALFAYYGRRHHDGFGGRDKGGDEYDIQDYFCGTGIKNISWDVITICTIQIFMYKRG